MIKMENAKRTFISEGKKWQAVPVARHIGIGTELPLPNPDQIFIVFRCLSDPKEKLRLTTIKYGTLNQLDEHQLGRELKGAKWQAREKNCKPLSLGGGSPHPRNKPKKDRR
jgi:hypothetical protein